jgi:TnpA family transposase
VHSTNTRRTKHVNFTLLHLFGYRFAPRYRNVRGKVETGLYGFHPPRHYEKNWPIKPIRRVRDGLIVSEWPNIERILLSLALKTTTQSVIVGKLSAYRRKNRFRRALWERTRRTTGTSGGVPVETASIPECSAAGGPCCPATPSCRTCAAPTAILGLVRQTPGR